MLRGSVCSVQFQLCPVRSGGQTRCTACEDLSSREVIPPVKQQGVAYRQLCLTATLSFG